MSDTVQGRFTIRRLMIAIAIVGLIIGLWIMKTRRDERLGKMEFYSRLERIYRLRQADNGGRPLFQANQERLERFTAMRRKWAWAALHPWLLVEPDSPE